MENTEKVLFEDDEVPQWYVALLDHWMGPLTAADVYEKVVAGEITWAHYVWKNGQAGWKRICDVKTFQLAVPSAPPKDIQNEIKEAAKPVVHEGSRNRAGNGAPPPPPKKEHESRIWFLYYNDSQFGPFSRDDIMRFLQAGKIHGHVHAWCNGMKNWEYLERLTPFTAVAAEARKMRAKPARRENRETPRCPLVAKILMASEKDESVHLGVCRDISIGGMQVLTDLIPGKAGTRIRLNVSPSSDQGSTSKIRPFVAQGIIVRILEDKRGFSFRFDRLGAEAKRAIEEYIGSSN